MDIRDELVRHIRRSSMSQADLCKQTNIDPGNLCRFLQGRQDLRLGAFVHLCWLLKLKLVTSETGKARYSAYKRRHELADGFKIAKGPSPHFLKVLTAIRDRMARNLGIPRSELLKDPPGTTRHG